MVSVEVEVEKMVKLAEQCLERVKSCLDRRHELSAPVSYSPPNPLSSLEQTTGPAVNVKNDSRMTGEP